MVPTRYRQPLLTSYTTSTLRGFRGDARGESLSLQCGTRAAWPLHVHTARQHLAASTGVVPVPGCWRQCPKICPPAKAACSEQAQGIQSGQPLSKVDHQRDARCRRRCIAPHCVDARLVASGEGGRDTVGCRRKPGAQLPSCPVAQLSSCPAAHPAGYSCIQPAKTMLLRPLLT